MTNEQILKKAIEKAIKNGFNPVNDLGEVDNINVILSEDGTTGHIQFYTKDGDGGGYELETVLYGLKKTFAKAFWGEKEYIIENVSNIRKRKGQYAWQYHLQQMVLEKEPLRYLEKFLEEK